MFVCAKSMKKKMLFYRHRLTMYSINSLNGGHIRSRSCNGVVAFVEVVSSTTVRRHSSSSYDITVRSENGSLMARRAYSCVCVCVKLDQDGGSSTQPRADVTTRLYADHRASGARALRREMPRAAHDDDVDNNNTAIRRRRGPNRF